MAVDCLEAMELRVAVIAGSLAREYHAKVPTISWMCLMPAGESSGVVSFPSI